MRSWTTTEAKIAAKRRAEGMRYRAIGRELGRSEFSVYGFLHPSYKRATYRYDLSRHCPACGAEPGEKCRGNNRVRKWAHLERTGR